MESTSTTCVTEPSGSIFPTVAPAAAPVLDTTAPAAAPADETSERVAAAIAFVIDYFATDLLTRRQALVRLERERNAKSKAKSKGDSEAHSDDGESITDDDLVPRPADPLDPVTRKLLRGAMSLLRADDPLRKEDKQLTLYRSPVIVLLLAIVHDLTTQSALAPFAPYYAMLLELYNVLVSEWCGVDAFLTPPAWPERKDGLPFLKGDFRPNPKNKRPALSDITVGQASLLELLRALRTSLEFCCSLFFPRFHNVKRGKTVESVPTNLNDWCRGDLNPMWGKVASGDTGAMMAVVVECCRALKTATFDRVHGIYAIRECLIESQKGSRDAERLSRTADRVANSTVVRRPMMGVVIKAGDVPVKPVPAGGAWSKPLSVPGAGAGGPTPKEASAPAPKAASKSAPKAASKSAPKVVAPATASVSATVSASAADTVDDSSESEAEDDGTYTQRVWLKELNQRFIVKYDKYGNVLSSEPEPKETKAKAAPQRSARVSVGGSVDPGFTPATTTQTTYELVTDRDGNPVFNDDGSQRTRKVVAHWNETLRAFVREQRKPQQRFERSTWQSDRPRPDRR